MRKSKEDILRDKLAKKDEEISSLKQKLSDLQDQLDLARLSNEMLKVKTDEIITDCENKLVMLNEAIKELNDLKPKYLDCIEQMKQTQKEQKESYKQLFKKLRKNK